ncbi:MAG TPA: AAA family ATPase [Candidatus Dormibacteraeota bacterium]|nr:AAA family ATPase [Candidatus Dormibacteraeota bacterium]
MSSTHSDGPLVARERQLQELWRQVAGSAETGLRVAVVRGPAGIGKTRLLQAFEDRARASGAAVIAGRSPHLGGHPHAALSDVLGAYVRTGGAAAAQVRRAGDALVGLVPALAAFDPRPPGAPDVVSVVQATFRLVRQVTERRPLVVIVDDAHLADADSCEVLATLQRHAADLPWTLALGWRDPADARPAARELLELLRRDREVVDIELAPLDGDDAAAFIAALLGDGLPARSLVEMLQARAAGNPYYLEEMVRWARARDAVRRAGLQWMPVAGLEQELPPSLEAALRERTRGLAPAARQLLEWLVVAGAPVGFPLLAGVTGMPAAALADALDDLRRAGLVAEHGGRRAEYTVHHPLLRECVLREMGAARRRLAHRTLAASLRDGGAAVGSVAAHLVEGAEPGDAEAAAAAMAAGEAAEAQVHYTHAVRWYEEVLQLVEQGDEGLRLRALDRLSELAAHAGRADLGLAAVNELLARTPEGDRLRRATFWRRLATLRVVTGDHERARAAVEQGLALASEGGPEAALLLSELAMVAELTLPVPEVLETVRRGRAIAAAAGAAGADLVLRGFEALGVAHGGEPRRALGLAAEAASDAMAAGEVLAFGYALFAGAAANCILGRFDDAARSMAALTETMAESAGVMWGAAWASALGGEACYLLGDLDAALRASLRSEETARRYGALSVLPLPVITSALVLLERGDDHAAAERLAEARRLLEERAGGFIEGWYWYAEGCLADARGDLDHAVRCHRRVGSWSESRSDAWMISLRPALVHTLIAAGRPAEALVEARRLTVLIEGRDLPLARLVTGGALAAALAACGDPGAYAEVQRALGRLGDVAGEVVPATVRLCAGGALLAAGRREEGVALLRRAEAVFAAGGWTARRAQAVRLLEQAGAGAAAGRRPGPAPSANAVLSGRELEVATLAGSGLSSRAIAQRLYISERTVENHLQRVYGKLQVHGRAALIARVANGHALG